MDNATSTFSRSRNKFSSAINVYLKWTDYRNAFHNIDESYTPICNKIHMDDALSTIFKICDYFSSSNYSDKGFLKRVAKILFPSLSRPRRLKICAWTREESVQNKLQSIVRISLATRGFEPTSGEEDVPEYVALTWFRSM
jgi:hypothetical protein